MARTPIEPDGFTAETLPAQFLFCRNAMHAWEEVAADKMDRPGPGQWWQIYRCIRCGTERSTLIGSDGSYLFHPRYRYPEGYRMAVKVTRSEMRVQWAIRNHYVEAEQAKAKRKSKTTTGRK